MSGKHAPLEERFWRFVEKTPTCWRWTGAPSSSGYGQIKVGKGKTARLEKAHRASYKLHHGDIPDGLYILHKCDNKWCVNPGHLFTGTQRDNMDDLVAKNREKGIVGRQPRKTLRRKGYGAWAKLSPELGVEIKALYATGQFTHRSLAVRYGVDPSSITRILNDESFQPFDE
jgi:hypothetical protein